MRFSHEASKNLISFAMKGNSNGLRVSQMVKVLRMLQHTKDLVTVMHVMMRKNSESIGQFAKFLKL